MEAGLSHSMEDGTNPPKPLDAGALFVLQIQRIMVALRLPSYHIDSVSGDSESSLCVVVAGVGGRSFFPHHDSACHVLFLQSSLGGLGAPRSARPAPASFPGHGYRYFRRVTSCPGWGRYLVGPIQIGLCYGTVIAGVLIGGQSLKFIYLLSRPNGTMQLYQFVIISGVLMLVLVQIPSFHSLRHINLVSLVLCLSFCASATAGSIYIGHSKTAPVKSYSVHGSVEHRLFGALNAISIIATTYGNGVIPEIQATIAPPVKGKMFKGLCVCYAVVLTTFFSVAISGYWAFGNQAKGTVLANFMVDEKALLPSWVLLMTNVFTLLQVSAVSLVYLQPTNEVLEQKFADPKIDQFAVRNVMPRLVFRSFSVVIATTLAAMLPFFGDINAVLGAFGFIPLDFILPMIFYNVTFKPKQSLIFWGNTLLAILFSALGALAAISSIRQIILDANTYRLFANI
uniref:Amino acid transporter transmembrane domain-containing protein n=1 Tax=Vitis vinifera TaxID=29760 RepID=A5ADL0_VITVI|nr:hypothetical protein VITISV_024339 [Vitis vinifera]